MPLDHNNSRVTRRRVLATAAATPALATPAIAQGVLKGTKLTVLAGQWYVPQTNTMLDELAAELGRDTGMEIRIERFAGDELMTKTAAVVGAGRGADLAVGVEFDTYVYAAKLNDVTDLADEIGRTYGGWLDSAKAASVVGGRWKSLPIGQAPAAWNWRTDMFRAAGLTKFPDTFADLLAAAHRTAHGRSKTREWPLSASQVQDHEGQGRNEQRYEHESGATRKHLLNLPTRELRWNLGPWWNGLAARLRYEHLLKGIELLDALPRAEHNTVQGSISDEDRHAGLVPKPLIKTLEQRAATGEDDTAVHDVSRELRRSTVQGRLDGVDNRVHRLVNGAPDFLCSHDDCPRQSGDEVAAAYFGVRFVRRRECRADGDLDLLGGALPQHEGVLLLHVLNDCVVEFIAANADRETADDAAE